MLLNFNVKFPFSVGILHGIVTEYIKINFHPQETAISWSVETEEETLVPKDLLSAYIEKLNSGETAHAEESAMVLFLLKIFINGLKPPLCFSKGRC